MIVTLGGLAELGLPMPGILAQTIADQIELIIVARAGTVSEADLLSLSGLQSVRLVEKPVITNRGLEAAAGIAVATADFIGLHENHTRAEPETYERLLAAFRADDAALVPVMYPANCEMPWGQAMYAVAHHHASPPNTAEPVSQLVLHHGLYRTELVRPFGKRMKNEPRVQTELIDAGYHLRYVPQTVVWHLNEARPRSVAKVVFALGPACMVLADSARSRSFTASPDCWLRMLSSAFMSCDARASPSGRPSLGVGSSGACRT